MQTNAIRLHLLYKEILLLDMKKKVTPNRCYKGKGHEHLIKGETQLLKNHKYLTSSIKEIIGMLFLAYSMHK